MEGMKNARQKKLISPYEVAVVNVIFWIRNV